MRPHIDLDQRRERERADRHRLGWVDTGRGGELAQARTVGGRAGGQETAGLAVAAAPETAMLTVGGLPASVNWTLLPETHLERSA